MPKKIEREVKLDVVVNVQGRDAAPIQYLEAIHNAVFSRKDVGEYFHQSSVLTREAYFFKPSPRQGRRLVYYGCGEDRHFSDPRILDSITKTPIQREGVQINEEETTALPWGKWANTAKAFEAYIQIFQEEGWIFNGEAIKDRALERMGKNPGYFLSFDVIYGINGSARQLEIEAADEETSLAQIKRAAKRIQRQSPILIRRFPRIEVVSFVPTNKAKWQIVEELGGKNEN